MTRIARRRDPDPEIWEPGSVEEGADKRSAASHAEHQIEGAPREHGGHGRHSRWMMIACCIPMLLIAVTLVATGVVGAGFLLVALTCTAMMAFMMGGMSHGDRSTSSHRH